MEWSTDLPEAEKQQIIAAYLGDLELYGCFEKNVEIGLYVGPQYSLGCFYAGEPLPNLLEDESDWVSVPFGPLAEGAWARQAWKTYRTVTSGPRSYTLAPKVTSDVMGLRPGWEHPERQAIRLSWGDNAIVALE
jgi:hypothetical protein